MTKSVGVTKSGRRLTKSGKPDRRGGRRKNQTGRPTNLSRIMAELDAPGPTGDGHGKVPWKLVRKFVTLGTPLSDIIARLELDPATVEANKEKFDRVVAAGSADFRIRLRGLIDGISSGKIRNASPTAALALARAHLGGFDKSDDKTAAQAVLVDIEDANQRLLRAIERVLGQPK